MRMKSPAPVAALALLSVFLALPAVALDTPALASAPDAAPVAEPPALSPPAAEVLDTKELAEATPDTKTEVAETATAEAKTSIVATATEAIKSDTAPGVGWMPGLLAALAVAISIFTKLAPIIPAGWRTKASIVGGVLALAYSALGTLSATGHALTLGAVAMAFADAWMNRNKTNETIATLESQLAAAKAR